MSNSNSDNKFKINLFGQDFFFTTTYDKKEELLRVANYYKNIVDSLLEKFPNKPHLDILVLSGLMIADELYALLKSRNKNLSTEEKEIERAILDLINSLDNVLKD
ncbi:MAG TPA: cell division protein ZapA [Spirochaetota bacterium]|nr:cell division protein ZapA [Spirochaetota bacterium]HOL56057.1 cell division protein ZapA [Spirochaetota bacterium]HPP03203.1 cell division protein ZapA [Spirochaetota bacterium]